MRNDNYIRYIRPLDANSVSQADILSLTGRTELGPFDELWLVHHGEDGLCLEVIQPRFMFIESQSFAFGELREEFQQEVYAAWMDQVEFEEALQWAALQQQQADPSREMFAAMGLEEFYDMMTERYGPPVVMTVQLGGEHPGQDDGDDDAEYQPHPTLH